jgi:transcriptional regulator with XRE-family HTH domain
MNATNREQQRTGANEPMTMRGVPTSRPDLPPGPWRDLVDLLRGLRSSRQLTDRRVAAHAHLSPSYVSEILNGRKPPSPDAAERLVRAYGGAEDVANRARVFAEKQREFTEHRRETAPRAEPRSSWTQAGPDGALFTNTGSIGGDVIFVVCTEPLRLERLPPEVPFAG